MYNTIAEIKRANRATGHHFFDQMHFFGSRIASTVINGRFFITSEQFEANDGNRDHRRYTIRETLPNGAITTLGEYQAYDTLANARWKASVSS
jgi:hypothetical protein